MKRDNKFKKINYHLKSKQIDERLELLNEIPTNNIGGLYTIEPGYVTQDPDYLDPEGDVDFTQDDPELNGRDTTGLFAEDGTILTEEPPGDTSYVLGPMSSMYYTYASPNFTTIGYINQSNRRMVNLGRITGRLEDWDGESNFTSYGQLTLEQAVWFRDIEKIEDYRAFYPGPPSGSPDEFGRYRCKVTGKPKPRPRTPPPRNVPPSQGGPEDSGFPWFPFGKKRPKRCQGGRPCGDTTQRGGVDKDDKDDKEYYGPGGDPKGSGQGQEPQRDPSGKDDNDYYGPGGDPKGSGKGQEPQRNPSGEKKGGGQKPQRDPSGGKKGQGGRPLGDTTQRGGKRRGGSSKSGSGSGTGGSSGSTGFSRSTGTTGGESGEFGPGRQRGFRLPGFGADSEPSTGGRPRPDMNQSRGQGQRPLGNTTQRGGKNSGDDLFKKLFDPKGPLKNLRDLGSKGMKQMKGVNDGFKTLEKVQNTINDAKNNKDIIPSSDPNGRPEIRPGAKGSPENPIDMPLSQSTIDYVTKGVYQGMDLQDLKSRIQQNTSQGIFSGGNIGAKGTFNNLAKDPYFDKNGDLIIPDTYGFDPGGDIAQKPFIFGSTVGDLAQGLSGAFVGSGGKYETQRQELEKDILTQFDKTTVGIILGAPGRKEPIVHMVTRIPKSRLPKTAVEAEAKKSFGEQNNIGSKNLLTESRKRILREIKKPYKLPEEPTKFKVKPTGRKNRVVGAELMNSVEVPQSFKPQPKLWRKKDYQANMRASQELKNEVLDMVGTSDHYWEYITETKRKKAVEERTIKMAEEFEKQMRVLYEQEINKQKKIDKLTSSFKKTKDIAPEYPKNPPPEMVNGWHPEYGDRANQYNKLDPHSAEAMPSTGNAEIDDKVRKARKIKKILKKGG